MSTIHVQLKEWESLGPDECEHLRSVRLEDDAHRMMAKRLAKQRVVEVRELHQGLTVRAFSHVGRIRLGHLTITVAPKLGQQELLSLFRYAYGLRDLLLLERAEYATGSAIFQDLLIAQLHAEAWELLDRGLNKNYVLHKESLASPRGRIDMLRLARNSGVTGAELPCQHFQRSSDHLLNRIVLAGLEFGQHLAHDSQLKLEVSRLAKAYTDFTSSITLTRDVLDSGLRQLNRLVAAYYPALKLITLLYSGNSIEFDDAGRRIALPGFMYDMNRFFQSLLARFLNENLAGHQVSEEESLTEMMRYLPGRNPLQRTSPRPRPDFIIKRRARVMTLLDAKYRDLWEKPLPREMLYQLAIYALSQPTPATSAILYPTMSPHAREAVIEIREPSISRCLGFVSLRPIVLPQLVEVLAQGGRGCEQLAFEMAFGDSNINQAAIHV